MLPPRGELQALEDDIVKQVRVRARESAWRARPAGQPKG
jgi:hypothetical protein